MTGRRGRRRRKLLDDLKERRRYSHLKEEALDRTMWRSRFGRGFGPVVRQTTNIYIYIYIYLRCINAHRQRESQAGEQADIANLILHFLNISSRTH